MIKIRKFYDLTKPDHSEIVRVLECVIEHLAETHPHTTLTARKEIRTGIMEFEREHATLH